MYKWIAAIRQRLWMTGLILVLSGCTSVAYYGQAISGHRQIMSLRQPVEDLLADPATPADLRQRLEIALAMRDFASEELDLSDSRSYRSYANLSRPFAVWNVFAAPELSLELKEWCFPVAGCVGYRGYFDRAAAQALGDELHGQGYDVYVAGVPAYSTLGWFDDPLLNTFIDWPEGQLAELLFHELAHQRLYIPDDTTFNESFATAVGRLGARLWLERHGSAGEWERYRTDIRRREAILELIGSAWDALAQVYDSDRPTTAKREEKQRILNDLQKRYQALKQVRDGYSGYDAWFAQGLNNAGLAALIAYTQYVPAFEVLFERSGRDFATFYQAVEEIGGLPPDAREARLEELQSAAPSIAVGRPAQAIVEATLSLTLEVQRHDRFHRSGGYAQGRQGVGMADAVHLQ